MALINRIQITNMIKSIHAANWSPRFKNEVFELLGDSSMFQMPNGTGKTSISNAFNALLSRRRRLEAMARERLAPANCDAYSHFRVEFVSVAPGRDLVKLAGGSPVGEKQVFGFYGNNAKDNPRFYYYVGTLEDLPVAEKDAEGRDVIFAQKRFDDLLADFKGVLRHEPKKEQWKKAVAEMIPLHVVDRMARFHEEGGGENASAGIFSFKPRRNEAYDRTFFWEVLAPELLANSMGGFASSSEEIRFEDTILRTVHGPVRAQIEGERQARDLARRREALAAMGPMVERGQDLLASRRGLDERLGELGGAMNVVQLVVGESGLPGFPRAVATDNPRVDNLLRHMVLDADKGVLLRDRGLAELLGKQAKHVNRDAEEKKVDHAELNQPIEITLDHGSSASSTRPQGGGPSNRFYASDQVGAFLEKSAGPDDPQPYLPAPREELKAAVAAAFEHFETRVDTNPFRQRSRRLAKAQAVNQAKAEDARKALGGLKGEIERLETGLKEFKETQGLYQEIVESGLFSEEELKHPARTGEALKVSRSELTRQLEAHERKWRGLTGQAGNFTRFQSAFGETADPRVLAAEWAEQRAVLDRNCSTAKGALGQADEAARKAKGEAGAASTDLTKLGSEKKALEDLREAAAPFLEAVPGQNPKGFAKEVRGRQLRLTGEKGRLEVELPRLKALVDRLEAWRTLHGEASPAVFIEEFIRAREALRDEKGAAERSLELLRADIQMLRKHKVAPGEVAAKALHIARECGKAATLHEFLDGLGLDQGRRADMLSLFSPILFAPVVADAAGAEPLLLRFDEERLPVPVFLEKELAEFSRTGVVATAEAGGIVHTFLAGRRSLTVECILDPEKLKRELDAAKAREKELQERFADLNRRHAAMGDSNADLKEARAVLAAQEDGALEKYNALAMRQEAMDAELSEISEKYPEMVLKAAERAEDLDAKGGLGRLRELDVLLDAAVERVKKAELHLKECEEKWKAAGESHEAAREALRQFELKISEFREVLKELIAFVEAGGPAFMARAEEISDALKNELKALGDKIGSFKFDRAQAYLDSLDKSEEESRLLLDRKIGEAGEMEKFLRALGDEERRLEADRQTALRKATSYDSHIAAILPSYKALAGLLEDKRVQEDLRRIEAATGVSFAPAPEIREILGRILAGLEDLDAHGDEILADLAAIRARLTEEQNLKGLVDRVEEGRAGLGQADRRYQDSCEQFFKNLPAAITVEAKAEIQERTRNPERLQEYVETKNKRFEEEAERCRKAREHEEELFEVAKKNLSQLAVNGKIALQTLKSVLGHHKNATFELEVHVVDDIEAVMSKLVYEVKRVQLQLDSEFGQDLFGTDPDEVDARKTLLQRISAELYRGLFPDPRIRVYFPQIRGEKKEVYSDKFSSGEKMALSLLWLSILAEFSMRQAETTYSDRIRPGKHEQGPSIFWIDGLFSHLSDVDIIKATMQLRASQGSFQLVGLMHNPANIPSHDFGTFPRLFVTRVQKSRAMATSKDWAVTEQFKEGQVDTILAFLDKGVLPAAEGNA